MEMQPSDFDLLDELARMSESQIDQYSTESNISALERALVALASADYIEATKRIDRTNIAQVARELRELRRVGSRQLGDAILKASDFVKSGLRSHAREVYETFLTQCPSKIYRQVAKSELSKLD